MDCFDCDIDCNDYFDCYKVVSDLLKKIGYVEIANFLLSTKNKKFFDSCVDIVLRKTPKIEIQNTKEILYISGVIFNI